MKPYVWIHKKLNNLFEGTIKMDILTHLAKFKKQDDRYLNHMLVLKSMLTNYEETNITKAKEELKACGYIGYSTHMQSQLYITQEGNDLLTQYNQFYNKGMLGKITWWFKNSFEGPWKIVWLLITTTAIILNLLIWFDTVRARFYAIIDFLF
jgi:hypothetical protein